ncbi:MAG TPA: glycosyltransferase family 87 protein, partial [bacterium]|nr:glycosyltransferase family 87 protein [bacterium]
MHPYSNFTPIYPYYFPPASLIIFWPLTLIPFYMAKIIFTLFNGFLLILSIFLINKMLVGKIDIRFWLLLLLSLLFYPLRFTFTDGQFNIVMLAIFTLGLYSLYKNKDVLGGVSLGVGVVTK